MSELYPNGPEAGGPGAISASETLHDPATSVSGTAAGSEVATRIDEMKDDIKNTKDALADESHRFSPVIKEKTSQVSQFIASRVSMLRERSREFLSTPTRKVAALGATALTLGGIMRMRRHKHEESKSNMDKLKARFS